MHQDIKKMNRCRNASVDAVVVIRVLGPRIKDECTLGNMDRFICILLPENIMKLPRK